MRFIFGKFWAKRLGFCPRKPDWGGSYPVSFQGRKMVPRTCDSNVGAGVAILSHLSAPDLVRRVPKRPFLWFIFGSILDQADRNLPQEAGLGRFGPSFLSRGDKWCRERVTAMRGPGWSFWGSFQPKNCFGEHQKGCFCGPFVVNFVPKLTTTGPQKRPFWCSPNQFGR